MGNSFITYRYPLDPYECSDICVKCNVDLSHTLTETIQCYKNMLTLPVSPQKVFLLLSDFRKWVSVTHLPELLIVVVSQGVVARQSVSL